MLRRLFDGARGLDNWLQERLGRPYNALLSVGLSLEMAHRIQRLPETWRPGAHDPLGAALALAMEAALLLHQLGEFSERAERRRAKARRDRPESADL